MMIWQIVVCSTFGVCCADHIPTICGAKLDKKLFCATSCLLFYHKFIWEGENEDLLKKIGIWDIYATRIYEHLSVKALT